MKVAVTARAGALGAKMDQRFGRAGFFVVADTGDGSFEAKDNVVNLEAAQGAGIQSAANVAELGVEAVITGHVGPKAFRALQAAGIKVYTVADAETVADALDRFTAGLLREAAGADVEGHWM